MSQTVQEAYERALKTIGAWSKAPVNITKSLGKSGKRVKNSSVALAAALAGAVPVPRKKKGGAKKKMTCRMSSSTKSKRMTRRKYR